MITKPMLKPISGYVEVEVNGIRMYKNVTTGEILSPEEASAQKSRSAEALTSIAAALTSIAAQLEFQNMMSLPDEEV